MRREVLGLILDLDSTKRTRKQTCEDKILLLSKMSFSSSNQKGNMNADDDDDDDEDDDVVEDFAFWFYVHQIPTHTI